MSIQSISSGTQTASLQSVSAAKSSSAQSSSASAAQSTSGSTADQASFSDLGKFLAKLQKLSVSDPAKFKEVTAKIAEKLKDAASSATGQDKDSLQKMADNFTKASESGKMDDVMPQQSVNGAGSAGTYGRGGSKSEHRPFGPPPGGPPPGPPPGGPPPSKSKTISSTLDDIDQLVDDQTTDQD